MPDLYAVMQEQSDRDEEAMKRQSRRIEVLQANLDQACAIIKEAVIDLEGWRVRAELFLFDRIGTEND